MALHQRSSFSIIFALIIQHLKQTNIRVIVDKTSRTKKTARCAYSSGTECIYNPITNSTAPNVKLDDAKTTVVYKSIFLSSFPHNR